MAVIVLVTDTVLLFCLECTCNILGTDAEAGPCDRTTGQCSCRSNVIGLNCDQCRENHWKIASGVGCEACDCDPVGSDAEQCNQVSAMICLSKRIWHWLKLIWCCNDLWSLLPQQQLTEQIIPVQSTINLKIEAFWDVMLCHQASTLGWLRGVTFH